MTQDQRFTLILSGLGLLFVVMAALLGLLVRVTIRWASIESHLADVAKDVAEHGERLTYLERAELRRYRNGTKG
jgi:hypothetical protein